MYFMPGGFCKMKIIAQITSLKNPKLLINAEGYESKFDFFASTAQRTIGMTTHHVDDYASIINLIESLPASVNDGFQIRAMFLESLGNLSGPKSHSNISNLRITARCFIHIF